MTNNDELALIAKAALKAGQGSKEMVEFRVTANLANILALLAERNADKKRIAELEREKETMTAAALAMRDDMRDARSLLEARTVSVKLPESVIDAICLTAAEIHNFGRGVSDERAQDIIDSIRCAAGIKLEVEEV
jgi:hypothetical protein